MQPLKPLGKTVWFWSFILLLVVGLWVDSRTIESPGPVTGTFEDSPGNAPSGEFFQESVATQVSYVNKAEIFVRDHSKVALEMEEKYGFPYLGILAVAAIETGYGTSDLAKHHNYHGLKCYDSKSPYVVYSDPEPCKFHKFETRWLGYNAFCQRLKNSKIYKNVIKQTEPEKFLEELGKTPYAGVPNYGERCLNVLRTIRNGPSNPF